MRYELPQFLDVEEHVVGPLTMAQFLYLGGGAGGAYICFRFLPPVINIVGVVVVVSFAAALAFLRVNNRPFPVMLYAMISHWFNPKMYLWSYDRATHSKPSQKPVEIKNESKKYLSDQKLHDIAWSLDVQETIDDRR